jgi:hypothetical protein
MDCKNYPHETGSKASKLYDDIPLVSDLVNNSSAFVIGATIYEPFSSFLSSSSQKRIFIQTPIISSEK